MNNELELKLVSGGSRFLSLRNTVFILRDATHAFYVPVERITFSNGKQIKFAYKHDTRTLNIRDDTYDELEYLDLFDEGKKGEWDVTFWVPREPEKREQLDALQRRVEDAKQRVETNDDVVVFENDDTGFSSGCMCGLTLLGLVLIFIMVFSGIIRITWLSGTIVLTVWVFASMAWVSWMGWIFGRKWRPYLRGKIYTYQDRAQWNEALAALDEYEVKYRALDVNLADIKIIALRRLRRLDETFACLEQTRPLFKPETWQWHWDETRALQRILERMNG